MGLKRNLGEFWNSQSCTEEVTFTLGLKVGVAKKTGARLKGILGSGNRQRREL